MQWTVGLVNWNSAYYFRHQIEVLYKHNHESKFKVIVVNNCQEDISWLKDFGVELIDNYPPKSATSSQQHAEGLNIIHSRTTTPYLLVQDPDFFWIKEEHLRRLSKVLDTGIACCGVRFYTKMLIGDTRFPSPIACAYRTEKLLPGDFDAFKERWELQLSKDVGWKIRERLSNEPFYTFPLVDMDHRWADWNKLGKFGRYSKIRRVCAYFDHGEAIGIHLLHGSWMLWPEGGSTPYIPPEWVESRKNHAAYFGSLIGKHWPVGFL